MTKREAQKTKCVALVLTFRRNKEGAVVTSTRSSCLISAVLQTQGKAHDYEISTGGSKATYADVRNTSTIPDILLRTKPSIIYPNLIKYKTTP